VGQTRALEKRGFINMNLIEKGILVKKVSGKDIAPPGARQKKSNGLRVWDGENLGGPTQKNRRGTEGRSNRLHPL